MLTCRQEGARVWPTRDRESGVTLIEMMVVVVIAGVLLALGVPSYRVWIENSRIRSVAESLADGLRVTKGEAIKSNQATRFSLADPASCVPVNTGSRWVAWVDTAAAPVAPAACNDARVIRLGERIRGIQNVVVKAYLVTTAGVPTGAEPDSMQFSSLGRSTGNIQGGWWIDIDVPTTVLPANESRNLRITVGQAGQIRVCDPDVENRLPATDSRRC